SRDWSSDVCSSDLEALGGTGSLEKAINGLKPIVQGFFSAVASMIPNIVQGFRNIIEAVRPWVPSFEQVKNAISTVINTVLTLYNVFMSLLLDTGEAGDLLTRLGISPEMAERIEDTLTTVVNVVKSAFATIYDTVTSILQGQVLPFIRTQLDRILKFWQENGEQIMEAVQNAFQFIQKVIETVMPAVRFIINVVWESIKSIISGALSTIQGLIKVFTGIFTGDFSMMWEGI